MTGRRGPLSGLRNLLGNRVAPPRFLLFLATLICGSAGWHALRGDRWADALVVGFDLGVVLFALSLWPLLYRCSLETMRRRAAENDANRTLVLVITALVSLAIMVAIAGEMPSARHGNIHAFLKLVSTLALAWMFANLVFALHYAHLHYSVREGQDHHGGFDFPGTPVPDFWDFIYFALTAGMSFAASDVNVTSTRVRRVVVLHSLLSFVFNIGVLAFIINVLAGAAG